MEGVGAVRLEHHDVLQHHVRNLTGGRLRSAFGETFASMIDSSVTSMERMFNCMLSTINMTFNQDIGSWDTSSVTTMQRMFKGCVNFNQVLSASIP